MADNLNPTGLLGPATLDYLRRNPSRVRDTADDNGGGGFLDRMGRGASRVWNFHIPGVHEFNKESDNLIMHGPHNFMVQNAQRDVVPISRSLGVLDEDSLPHSSKPASTTAAGETTGGTKGKSKTKINRGTGLPVGIYTFIKKESGNPDMTIKEAQDIFHHYSAQQKNPGLSQFIQNNTKDPLAQQTLYSNAIAPFLQQTAQTFNTGANAGYDAMQKILSSSAMPQAERDVLKANAPIMHANDMKYGAALGAATAQQPLVNDVLSKLQSMIDEQQQARYYQNQQIAALNSGGSSGSDGGIDPSIAALIAQSLK